jgi:chromosome segregation ATPase
MSADDMNTKPTIETVLERISAVQEQNRDIALAIESFRSEALRALRQIDRQIEHLSGEITRLHAGQRDLESRMDDIEKRIAS